MADKKQKSNAQMAMELLMEIIKKGEEFDPDGMVSGQEFVADFMSRISQPETAADKALNVLMQLEMMDRSGQVPPGKRNEFLNMRDLAGMRAGLLDPEKVQKMKAARDQGTGWIQKGDEIMFLGDTGPGGEHHRYVAGSEEAKKRQSEIEQERSGLQEWNNSPSPIFGMYQKAYDERIENEKFAKLEAEQDRVAKWGRGGSKESELGTNRGMYPETPWTADQQAGMRDQGQPVDPKGMSKRRGPTGEEIGGRTLGDFRADRQSQPPAPTPAPTPPPSIAGSPDQQEKARGKAKSLWDRIKQGPALPTGRFD